MRPWIDIATLVKPHNQKGAFLARGAKGLPFLLSEGMEVALVPPALDAPRRVTVAKLSLKNDDEAYVTFEEVSDGQTAHLLAGCHCLARREQFDPDDIRGKEAVRWDGWEVYDTEAGLLGTVDDVLTERLQPLLCVKRPDGRDLFIPLVDEFVVDVDEEALRIEVSLVEGMLDL